MDLGVAGSSPVIHPAAVTVADAGPLGRTYGERRTPRELEFAGRACRRSGRFLSTARFLPTFRPDCELNFAKSLRREILLTPNNSDRGITWQGFRDAVEPRRHHRIQALTCQWPLTERRLRTGIPIPPGDGRASGAVAPRILAIPSALSESWLGAAC